MKMGFALVVLAAFAVAVAQDNPTSTQTNTTCGPLDVHFDAKVSATHSIGQPESGKALVYVAEDFRKAPGELGNPTLRIGVDGSWIGAVRADSYLFFSVDPGEHHLCTSWQSRLERLSRLVGFARFTAEPGKTYYFRARVTYSTTGTGAANMNLDLERIDPDQGQFLVASYHQSNSHPKK